MAAPSLSLSRTQLRWLEWLALAALLLGLVAWASLRHQPRVINTFVQDITGWLSAPQPRDDIVIVAIDDASLQSVGRWPWSRAVHAQLIARIAAQQPKALGVDVLFSEPDWQRPQDDAQLAQAIAQAGNVVLPVDWRMANVDIGAELPLPILRSAARQLGHVNVTVDDDGVIRRYFGAQGENTGPWPHFSIAMLCASGQSHPLCQGTQPPEAGEQWEQRSPEIFNFARGDRPYALYAAEDVLANRVPPDAFRSKYVLIGATASGLGDYFASPARPASRHIAGVELIAHALDSQLSDQHVHALSSSANLAVNLGAMVLALMAIALLGPMAGLIAQIATAALLLLLCLALRSFAGLQLAPGAALVGLLVIYPIWSWRRLSAAAQFLQQEMHNLRAALDTTSAPQRNGMLMDDFLERRIKAVETATDTLRQMHGFVRDTLRQIPSPTFVVDPLGMVSLHNAAAGRYLQDLGLPSQGLIAIQSALNGMRIKESGQVLSFANAEQLRELPAECEVLDRREHPWLLLAEAFRAPAPAGWLLMLVDLTELHKAMQQRDQALRFISHDFRSPQASIITLLEMYKEFPGQMSEAELHQKINRLAHQSLEMAESFVQLASAQSQAMQPQLLSIDVLLQEAVDDCWAKASEKKIQLRYLPGALEAAETDMACLGDRSLLQRCFTNLLTNAIKYSPSGTAVEASMADDGDYWLVRVRDHGFGMTQEQLDQLFQPFQRFHQSSQPQISGIGLGLSFVHTVVQRHQGFVTVTSAVNEGSCFSLHLPKASAAPPGLAARAA
ncbi:CHASE2 domain-containing sensor protein/signal transduction histidine kinase [Comamonas sp. BIGb0152]|uniref:CHASE2 and HATPase_c domain-containing protein n=1 Tax=Comamonas sp. BIGb0152 TaxID=2940601 RepID=UPI00216A3217|nr:CHASE2 and HATPase_c domain-containing protein [Comamonas sp. BIGb0152]MCS4292001.1 CHASE2 domain-containing sensor protein/signal transduction histidine kinase [Comamonas sp. BIGb0152]